MAAPLLDPLVVRELKKLFLTSGKAIAVYTNDLGSLHYLPVWPSDEPAKVHPKHPDHRLAGFIDWATGGIGAVGTAAGQDKAPAGQRLAPTIPAWARGWAILWTLVKVMLVLYFGLIIVALLIFKVVVTAACSGSNGVGSSGGGGWGRR